MISMEDILLKNNVQLRIISNWLYQKNSASFLVFCYVRLQCFIRMLTVIFNPTDLTFYYNFLFQNGRLKQR